MKTVSMIINARWVIPVVPSETIYENYSVVIEDERIIDILPTTEVAEKYVSDSIVDRKQHVIMPGLINMHAHAAMSLFKGYSDDKILSDWLQQDIWPAEGKFVGPEFCSEGTKLACAEMIRSGTTCYNDMYFAIEDAARTSSAIGIRAIHGPGVFGFPTSWASGPDECLSKNRDFIKEHKDKTDLIHYAICPHAPYTVPEHYMVESKKLSRELGVLLHTHVQETQAEMEDSINGNKASSSCHLSESCCTPIANMAKLNILENTICAHCVHVTKEDIQLLAEHHASVVHNPTSNLKLASGICPVQEMLDAGVNVCLGTDSACSNNNLDMFSEMRNAALVGKVRANNPQACSAMTVITMATLNGAKALHLENEIGSIEVGKRADLISVDMNRVEVWPLQNILSHIVYAAGRDQVTDVWVNGKYLMKERELTTIDMDEVRQLGEKWNEKLTAFKNEMRK